MMNMTRVVCSIAAIGLLVVSCGEDGPDGTADLMPGTPDRPRVIEVEMVDIGYAPSAVDVGVGETVEFAFTNHGSQTHEAVFGDDAMQEDHEVEMQEMGDMAMDHAADEGDMAMDHSDEGEMAMDHDEGVVAIAVEPGDTTTVVMTYDESGHTLIGCHEPGHWSAGMKLDVAVA